MRLRDLCQFFNQASISLLELPVTFQNHENDDNNDKQSNLDPDVDLDMPNER